jgi:hypothetical protein
MPSDFVSSSVAAGAIATPFQGRQYEFIGSGGQIAIGLLAEATGMLATIFLGGDLVLEEAPVPIGTANQIPVWPDHFLVQENVYPGTRVKVQLRNTSGGTIVNKSALRIAG